MHGLLNPAAAQHNILEVIFVVGSERLVAVMFLLLFKLHKHQTVTAHLRVTSVDKIILSLKIGERERERLLLLCQQQSFFLVE